MTPLQQAAQKLLDRWDSTYWKDQRATSEYVNALRVALEAEQAQTSLPATHKTTGWVAPVDWYAVPVLFNPYTGEPRDVRDVQSDPQGVLIVPPGKVEMLAAKPTVESVTDCMMNLVDRLGHEASDVDARAWEHLLVYAPKQAQAVEPATGERAGLIAKLRWAGAVGGNETCTKAADMLEADAQQRSKPHGHCTHPKCRDIWSAYLEATEKLSKYEPGAVMHLNNSQQVAPYDQQALELCDACGWKAIMPGEPCFVCNMKTEAQQVTVPVGWALVPVVPTPEMIAAGGHVNSEWLNGHEIIYKKRSDWLTQGVYKAMLAAAQEVKPVAQQVAVPERTLRDSCNKGNLCPWSDEGEDGRSYCLRCGAKSQGSGQ